MPDKEKLVEIIQNSVGGCARNWAEVIADGLIAHGVTFAKDNDVPNKWISVKDRLPDLELVEAQANDKELYKCLVTMKHRPSRGGKCVREMWYDGEGFVDGYYIDWTALITHWMPLPEPPKGE